MSSSFLQDVLTRRGYGFLPCVTGMEAGCAALAAGHAPVAIQLGAQWIVALPMHYFGALLVDFPTALTERASAIGSTAEVTVFSEAIAHLSRGRVVNYRQGHTATVLAPLDFYIKLIKEAPNFQMGAEVDDAMLAKPWRIMLEQIAYFANATTGMPLSDTARMPKGAMTPGRLAPFGSERATLAATSNASE